MVFPALRPLPSRFLLGFILLLVRVSFAGAAPTTVTGHVEHPAGARVALFIGRHPVTNAPLRSSWAELDAAGNFQLTIPDLPFSQIVEFAHGGETAELFLTPGDQLQLSVDAGEFDETLHFTGSGANANNYLVAYFLRFEDIPLPTTPPAPRPEGPGKPWRTPQQEIRLSDSLNQIARTFLRDYAAKYPLPTDFSRYARDYIIFESAAGSLWYPYLRRKREGNPSLAAPDFVFDNLRKVPSLDSAMRRNSGGWNAIAECYEMAVLWNATPPVTAQTLPTQLTAHFGHTHTRDVMMARYCMVQLNREGPGQAQPFIQALQRMTSDTLLLGPVQRMYQRKLKFDGGQPAPDFIVRDATGKEVRLSDFRGKVVYLDFWASWCGPCLLEMPASARLREKFAGKDVVFLYVSVDTKEEAWKAALAKPGLTGANAHHGWAQGFETPAAKAYSVESVPAYFIIDRQGRLQKGPAPRPSAGQATIDALNIALGK
jgi:thiol-disulfide isomerase/thioredoxin